MQYVIGLDIGGTKIHSIVAEWDKDFMRTRKVPKLIESRRVNLKNKTNGNKFFAEIITEIDSLLKEFREKDIVRLGVGIAGPLSRDKVILNPPNLPLKNFSVLKNFKKNFKLPVYVDNDANCFAWAEHLFGSARKASSTVGITLGTGVGGGIVLDRNGESFLWDGYNGSAAEIGHVVLDASGGPKHNYRTFEELCSSRAKHLWKNSDPLSIAQKARRGNREAKEIYRKFGFWLGVGIANAINTIDPEILVVGGSIAHDWDLFGEAMNKGAKKYIISTQAKKTKIVRAKLGDDAGALGAAYLL